MKVMSKLNLISAYRWFSFTTKSFSQVAVSSSVEFPHKVRTMISANMYSDPHDNIHDSWGYGVTSESDTAMGYMSVGGSLTYYTADTKDEVKQMGSLSYGRQSDLAMNSYVKIRLPSSYRMFSVYGLAGIGLHLLNKKYVYLPETYQSAYTFGGDYGGGAEFRLGNLILDAKYLKRVAFNRKVKYADMDEVTIGIGIEFFTWSFTEAATSPKKLKKMKEETY